MIGYQIAIQATRRRDAVALVYGRRALTYAQLHRRITQVATALDARGIRRGDRVALLLHNCPQVLEILFACALLGAIAVPVNFRLVAREIALVLDASTPRLLLAGQAFDEVLAQLRERGELPPLIRIDDNPPGSPDPADDEYERWLTTYPATDDRPHVAADAPWLLLHSSGTTGLPKGIVYTHTIALASSSAKIIDLELTADDTTVVFGPLFHAGPLMDLTLPLLLRGGRVVLGASRHFEPQQLLRTIAEHRGTVIPIYPTMLRRVLDTAHDPSLDLRSLRLIITGGEAAPLPVIEGVLSRFPHAAFVNNYGSTDGGPVTTWLAPADSRRKMGSVGKEAFSVELRIVDTLGRAVGADVVGEITVRSPFVCAGYWNRPDETAAQLRNGWWYTGDLGYRDGEGFLWISGRSKDMIKSGTENIYPIEVEQVIAGMKGIREVAVIGVPDPQWGETVAAYVALHADWTLTEQDVITHCRTHLAGYKRPHHVVFVDNLPRGTTSKVSKQQLRSDWARRSRVDRA